MSTEEDIHGFHSLSSQVGGHPGVMANEDGSLVIKPAAAVEVQFYQSALSDPAFEPLLPYLPKFYGTLKFEGHVDQEKSAGGSIVLKENGAEETKGVQKDSIVLENLSRTFLKPNILDIKLGRVLYDQDATEEKRIKMEERAHATTSFETGVRLTGFQVYDVHKGVPVHTQKSYGRSIKPSDLPDGLARFFPIASAASEELPLSGDTSIREEPVGTGLPSDVLLPILESLREDVAEIRQALSEIHLRMVGGSLLIVYEADWNQAREGVKYWLEGEGEDDEDNDEDDEDGNEGRRPRPPYSVKLIDFAHTRLVPGQGPDEGLLFGLDTTLRLLDGRIGQVKAALRTSS